MQHCSATSAGSFPRNPSYINTPRKKLDEVMLLVLNVNVLNIRLHKITDHLSLHFNEAG